MKSAIDNAGLALQCVCRHSIQTAMRLQSLDVKSRRTQARCVTFSGRKVVCMAQEMLQDCRGTKHRCHLTINSQGEVKLAAAGVRRILDTLREAVQLCTTHRYRRWLADLCPLRLTSAIVAACCSAVAVSATDNRSIAFHRPEQPSRLATRMSQHISGESVALPCARLAKACTAAVADNAGLRYLALVTG